MDHFQVVLTGFASFDQEERHVVQEEGISLSQEDFIREVTYQQQCLSLDLHIISVLCTLAYFQDLPTGFENFGYEERDKVQEEGVSVSQEEQEVFTIRKQNREVIYKRVNPGESIHPTCLKL